MSEKLLGATLRFHTRNLTQLLERGDLQPSGGGPMKVLLVAVSLMLMGACAPMQQIERVPEVDPKMAESFAQTKSFVYERAIVRGERGEGVVTVQGGLACVPHAQGLAQFRVLPPVALRPVAEDVVRRNSRLPGGGGCRGSRSRGR